MITREDVAHHCRYVEISKGPDVVPLGRYVQAVETVKELISERDEALKLKEAYRELVLDYESLDEYGVSKSLSPRQIKFIDAEARRIMEGK